MDTTGPLIDPAPRTLFGVPGLGDLGALDAQVAFLGVPYDGGTPQPGIPTGQRAGLGDVAIQGSDTEANYGRITGAARGIVESGALMVGIGGDHSISFPLGRGMEPLGEFDVVHVDAHADFLDELAGARLTGASQLRRLAELPFVGTVTALGVRNADRAEVDGRDPSGATARVAAWIVTHFLSEIFDRPR